MVPTNQEKRVMILEGINPFGQLLTIAIRKVMPARMTWLPIKIIWNGCQNKKCLFTLTVS